MTTFARYALVITLLGGFFTAQAQNTVKGNVTDLPTISNFPKGYDPEIGYGSDFISTSFVFGVNVKF